MSLIDREIQTLIDRGGRSTFSTDSVPVLFGTRLIDNPRVIWAKTQDLGEPISKDVPKQNYPFALMAVLCYGEVESVSGLYVNGSRMGAPDARFLSRDVGENEFKDGHFFGKDQELSGTCNVSRGENPQRDFLDRFPEKRKPKFNNLYNGLSIAYLYVDVNTSSSFNNWSFLTSRFGSGWQDNTRKIKAEVFSIPSYTGGDTKSRHIVLAVDCSSINGLGVNFEGGRLKYRYDYIREETVKTILGYKDVLKNSEHDYEWSLEVVVILPAVRAKMYRDERSNYQGISYSFEETGPGSQWYQNLSVSDVYPITFDWSYDGSRYTQKKFTGSSYYVLRSKDVGYIDAYLNALASAVEKHPALREAHINSPFNVERRTDYTQLVDPAKVRTNISATALATPAESTSGWKSAVAIPQYINEKYSPQIVINAIATGVQEYGRNNYLLARALRMSPCDYSGVFDYVRTVRAQDMRINHHSAPQISFISGPTWPHVLASVWGQPLRWTSSTRYVLPDTRVGYITPFERGSTLDLLFGGDYDNRRVKAFIYGDQGTWVPTLSDMYKMPNLVSPASDPTRGIPRDSSFARLNYFLRPRCEPAWYRMWGSLRDVYNVKYEDFRIDSVIFDPVYYNDMRSFAMDIQPGTAPPIDTFPLNWRRSNQRLHDVYLSDTVFFGYDQVAQHFVKNNGALPLFDKLGTLLFEYPFSNFVQDNYHKNDNFDNSAELPPRDAGSVDLRIAAGLGVITGKSQEKASKALLDGMKEIRSEVVPGPRKYRTIYGMNPVHIIHDCFNNPYWGKGKFPIILDEKSFIVAADRCAKEELAIGLIWNRKDTLNAFVNEVLRHMDAVLFSKNDILYIKLVGAPIKEESSRIIEEARYTVEIPNRVSYTRTPVGISDVEYRRAQTLFLNRNNVVAIRNFKVPRESELINTIVVEYKKYSSTASDSELLVDSNLVYKYGTNSKTVRYPGAMTPYVAGKIGKRELLSYTSPLVTCEADVYTNVGNTIVVGDIIKFQWPPHNVEEMYMRVTNISRGDARNNMVTLRLMQAMPGDKEFRGG